MTPPARRRQTPPALDPPLYISGGELWVVVVQEQEGTSGEYRPARVVGTFDTEDRADGWGEENLGGHFSVVPFEITPGHTEPPADAETARQ